MVYIQYTMKHVAPVRAKTSRFIVKNISTKFAAKEKDERMKASQ